MGFSNPDDDNNNNNDNTMKSIAGGQKFSGALMEAASANRLIKSSF